MGGPGNSTLGAAGASIASATGNNVAGGQQPASIRNSNSFFGVIDNLEVTNQFTQHACLHPSSIETNSAVEE
jgi:hypothetical protein